MFLKCLFNIVFPKPKKPLIVDFVGPYGVGKTYLLKKIHFKYDPTVQTKNFAIGIFHFLKLKYPKTYQDIETEFKKYPNLSPNQRKYLTAELCARTLERIFYIDESIMSTFPIETLENFNQEHPDLLSTFFKNTIVIHLTDSLPNIQEKLKARGIAQKKVVNINMANENFYNMNRRIEILKQYNVPVLTLNANASKSKNIKEAHNFIKKYRNS